MRYFLHFAYNGKDYHGWQRQPGNVTVQERVEDALSLILRQNTGVVGAGRTDAGVNASMMVAHFDTEQAIPDKEKFIASMNGIADPMNIVFFSVKEVPEDAHARFDALTRTYRYYVHTRKSPFLFPYSLFVGPSIDFEAMNSAASSLLAVDDFTSFAKLHGQTKTNICNVISARWEQCHDDGNRLYFEITANRFLRNMVRAITGTLLEVGRGKITAEEFNDIISRKDRRAAGTSLPPSPLFLHEVTYPYWKP